MAYSIEDKERIFNSIISEIENGASLRSVLRKDNMPDSRTFYKWIDEEKEKFVQYERSIEQRANVIFDEMFEIADKQGEDVTTDKDGNKVINPNIVQRNRLQIDVRKWALSKMMPKKFGDKMDHTTGGDKLTSSINVNIVKPTP